MAGQHGGIPDAITRAKESTGKFIVKLTEVNNDIIYGKKTIDAVERAQAAAEGGKRKKQMIAELSFFKDPSITSLTTILRTLNSFELCNPASFALNQAFPPGSDGQTKFLEFQGQVRDIFEKFRNFSIVPGRADVTGVTVNRAVRIERNQTFTATFPPLNNNKKYPITQDTSITFKSVDPKVQASMTGRVIKIDGNNFDVQIERASTLSPPVGADQQPLVFENFAAEFTKQQSGDIVEISEELASVAAELREIGFQDILNTLQGIPPNFPGLGKVRETFIKVGDFINAVGLGAAPIADELDDASQFLAGGLTSRQVLEGSRLFNDLFRKIEPIVNFQNTLVTGYKDTIENLNKILRDVIPFEELSKFIKFITDFARIVQGVVSMVLALLNTINGIIKIISSIIKVFLGLIKVVKGIAAAFPAIFATAGIIGIILDKIDQAEGALALAQKFLLNLSKFIGQLIRELTILKIALQVLINEGAQLAAKLGSCGALSGNGMESAMAGMVQQIRGSLRALTGALPNEDYYPDDPNAPGRGLQADKLPDGIQSFVRLPGGEIMFVNDSIIGFDEDGNLIFFGDLTSLATGVNFNDTLGQDFRNRNLRYYTFDKFRNSQASMLNEADRLADERNNRIQEVDPEDRFGNFQEYYRGYNIKIQEEIEDNVNAQTVTRRRGIALDSDERITVSTELTFANKLSQIVNEVKFLIDRDIKLGLIGINTTDAQANQPSDDDAMNLIKTTGANKVAVSNIEAENNDKASATLPDRPARPVKSRVGNQPFESNENAPIQSRGKTTGGSKKKPINVPALAQAGLEKFVDDTPALKTLASNLGTFNAATTDQLSNLFNRPGIENMTEDEIVELLKDDILTGLDPNPDKIEEVKEKTQKWYLGIRAKARVSFDALAQSQQQGGKKGTSRGYTRRGGATTGKPKPEFEPFVTKIELKEIPKWIKLLEKQKYTQGEINAGLQNEGITDKYIIKIKPDGKIDIRKRIAFQEGNFNNKKRG